MNLAEIKKFLNKEVRPSLASHGGGIEVIELVNDTLKVRLTGACSGCPASQMTMEKLVSKSLKEEFPELKDVEAVSGVSDSLINQAKEILKRR